MAVDGRAGCCRVPSGYGVEGAGMEVDCGWKLFTFQMDAQVDARVD
jgi:hypothetical protein